MPTDPAAPDRTPPPSGPPSAALLRRDWKGGGLLLSVFLLSGGSGLVFQVVWSRALTLVFGSTTQAVATVLAAFMGGLALGSWAASKVGDRIRRPLRAYGLLEAGIGACALLVLFLTPALDAAYRAIYPFVELSLPGLTFVRFLLACAFLLPATTLMGATLPVLSAAFERRGPAAGEGASTLYAVNTLGAVVGTAAAGFWLLPVLGLTGSTLVAAAGNAAAALAALHLSRRAEREGVEIALPSLRRAGPRGDEGAESPPLPVEAKAAVAAAIALSGAGALILEVVWTRTLSLILGSSTQAFTVMLTTFLVGLAGGSAAASRLLRRIPNPLAAFALVELAAGLAVYLGVFVFPELPYAFVALFRTAQESPALLQGGRFALAASVMLAPTLLLGAVFPLAVRCHRLGAGEAARPVGFLYAVNTLGAIAGSLAAGFLLIPGIGLRQTLIAGAVVNLSVGAFLLAVSSSARPAWRFGLSGLILLLLPALPSGAPAWNPLVMTSGVFQYAPQYTGSFPTRREFLDYHARHGQLFYRDGPTTTVTVEKRPHRPEGKVWLVLTVNGKVDASSVADMDSQILVGQMPLFAARDPRSVLVIGWGSGVTVGSVLTHPSVGSVHAVEIEPAVLEASRLFRDFNGDPFGDPRLTIEVNDARHTLLVADRAWDVIISEPSNPWLSGPSRLFTREFFDLAKSRLAPGGILCQWVQLYGLDVESYRTLLRTVGSVFEEVVVLKGSAGDTLVMASSEPIRFDLARIAARMREPRVAADLRRIRIGSPAGLLARFRAGGPPLRAFVGEGPLNTDDNALIEFAAARNLYRSTDHENDLALLKIPSSPLDHAELSGLPPEEAVAFPIDLAVELSRLDLAERARAALDRAGAAEGSPAAAARSAVLGDILEKQGDAPGAVRAWEEALAVDPSCRRALLALARRRLEVSRDPQGAAALYARAAAADPRDAESRVGLGRALLAGGKPSEALAVLEEAAALDPPRAIAPFLHMSWGRACLAAGDAACAVRELPRYFREWTEIPKPAETSLAAALDLGRAHLDRGETEASLEWFRTAGGLASSLASWRRERAAEALEKGDAAAAEAHLRQAVAYDPADPASALRLGDLLMRQSRWPDAESAFREILARRPEEPVALGGLVQALREQGRLAEAVPQIRLLIDLEEDPGRIAELQSVLASLGGAR